jgi:hypothetical protein
MICYSCVVMFASAFPEWLGIASSRVVMVSRAKSAFAVRAKKGFIVAKT